MERLVEESIPEPVRFGHLGSSKTGSCVPELASIRAVAASEQKCGVEVTTIYVKFDMILQDRQAVPASSRLQCTAHATA